MESCVGFGDKEEFLWVYLDGWILRKVYRFGNHIH